MKLRVSDYSGQQGDQTSQSRRKSTLNTHWKDWCWSWSSNTLATWCEELSNWKRPWCWGRLKAWEEESSITVFSNELALHIRWPKYCSFSYSISPSNENSGLISFRTDWFDLLAVQGTLKSLLQHHSSKASILQHSAFFMVQLSHPYMTTIKIITLTIQTILK